MAQQKSDTEDQVTVRDVVIDTLLDKIDADPYPSITMMDRVEELLTSRHRVRYLKILLSRVRNEEFPSWDMINRLIRLSN